MAIVVPRPRCLQQRDYKHARQSTARVNLKPQHSLIGLRCELDATSDRRPRPGASPLFSFGHLGPGSMPQACASSQHRPIAWIGLILCPAPPICCAIHSVQSTQRGSDAQRLRHDCPCNLDRRVLVMCREAGQFQYVNQERDKV